MFNVSTMSCKHEFQPNDTGHWTLQQDGAPHTHTARRRRVSTFCKKKTLISLNQTWV